MTTKKLQFKRYANTVVANTVGADGELIVDTTNYALTVHDGSTPGGTRLATETFVLYNTNIETELAQSGYNQANTANTLAQSGFDKANTVINYLPLTGGTLTNNLTVQGNISISFGTSGDATDIKLVSLTQSFIS